MIYSLGYKPSPPDKVGDGHPTRLLSAAPLPVSVSLRSNIVEVLNQLDSSSCVAHAVTQQVRANLVRQGIQNPPLPSRLFVYYGARAENGEQSSDDGTFIHSAYDAMAAWGFPPESAWTFTDDPAKVNHQPEWEAMREAADQKWMTGRYRITSTGTQRVRDVKAALAAGHTVTWGTDVDAPIFDLKRGEIWPGVTGPIEGGHAVLIVGYAPGYFDVCNSWGRDWCDDGYFRVSEGAVASPNASDFWVATVAPNFSEAA